MSLLPRAALRRDREHVGSVLGKTKKINQREP
jgi:hypothetical protein